MWRERNSHSLAGILNALTFSLPSFVLNRLGLSVRASGRASCISGAIVVAAVSAVSSLYESRRSLGRGEEGRTNRASLIQQRERERRQRCCPSTAAGLQFCCCCCKIVLSFILPHVSLFLWEDEQARPIYTLSPLSLKTKADPTKCGSRFYYYERAARVKEGCLEKKRQTYERCAFVESWKANLFFPFVPC